MAKKTNRRKNAKGRKKRLSGMFQQDFLGSLFGGGGTFPLALPMKSLVPTPPKRIFPPDFMASAAHFGGVPPISPEMFMPPKGLFENLALPNIPGMESLFPENGYQNAFGFGGKRKMVRTAGRAAGGIKAMWENDPVQDFIPFLWSLISKKDLKEAKGEKKKDENATAEEGSKESQKEDKGKNKSLEKILRLLQMITKGRGLFGGAQMAAGGKFAGIPGLEMLSSFGPAIASFVAAVKMFDMAQRDREQRENVEQRVAALGMDARKAFSADVTMKAFGGNFESIAKPMASWAEAMTGVQMGDASKFSNIMKQVAELSGMGYNVDLRQGSGKFGMASNEEFFTRMTDALSQALQKGDIGAQQKIQSIAGFDSSIADILTSVKGSKGSDVLKYAFSREDSMAARTKAGSRYGRRAASAGWDALKDTVGSVGSAALDILTGPVLFEGLSPVLNPGPAVESASKKFGLPTDQLPKKAKGGRETRPAIFAEAGPEWFIPEKNDENSRALLISAAQACGFDMFAAGGSRRTSRSLGFKGPNNDWRARRRGLLGGSRTTAESLGFRGPTHDWRVNNRTFSGDGVRMSERLGFKGPSPVNHTNTVTMNISKVEVSANNAKEFVEAMVKARQNPLSNVAKSIASSVDTKRIA